MQSKAGERDAFSSSLVPRRDCLFTWLGVTCLHMLGCAPNATQSSPASASTPQEQAALGREEVRGVPLQRPLAVVPISPGDPMQGRFTLEQASAGVDGEGVLTAVLETSMGTVDCELFEDRAPITVANFVGLARGVRPFRTENGWVGRPFYDNSLFHRVVPGFVIQAGSFDGALDGGPGYVIPDEVWQGSKHDRAGLLCMANDGPDTGGSQFFIMAGRVAPQLDGSYTIFGSCYQTDVIDAISRVKAFGEKPAEEVSLRKVTIVRAPSWD